MNRVDSELSSIREIYANYPDEPVSADMSGARQAISYLLGVVEALLLVREKP